jgi:hypothetical protein
MPTFQIWTSTHSSRKVEIEEKSATDAVMKYGSVKELGFGLEAFTGYSIINAESKEEALELAKTNPMITSVIVYELAKM